MTVLRKKSYFIKKELAYFGILIFSVFVIYRFFGRAFSDVQIGEHSKLANVFLLTVNNYLYMLSGLLLLGFTLYIYMHMKAYMAGKLFTLYLLLITIGICLAAVNYGNKNVNLYIALLMCVSNIILYYLIGRLTLTATKKIFRRLSAAYLLLVFGMIFGMAYVQRNHLDAFPGKIVMFDYAITIILIFVNLIYGYKGATVYSKQQIKCLINGILSGIVIFVVMQFMPTVAVVGIMGQADDTAAYSRISVENINFIRGILPIAILVGIVVAITYLFIKREYVSMEDDYELRRYMASILYLVAANTCFRLLWIDGVTEFIVLNVIIILPLLVSSCQSYLRKGTVYDSKMVEVLEDERQRLSVFLYDEILQDLISFSYVLKSEQEKERLSAMIGEIRRISQELYPIIVEDLGVDAALEIFLADIKSDYNVEIEYHYTCPGGVLPAKISMVLYRTVKELVMNAMKHSCCRHMEITVGKEEHEIVCIVTDDGKGFQIPENEDLLKSPHMGIYVMKKQIAESGGRIRIISDSTGSEFEIHIPLR